MEEQPADVLTTRLPDVTVRRCAFTPLHAADRLDGGAHNSSPVRTGSTVRPGEDRPPSRNPLPRYRESGIPGGMVPSDDELLERTLVFAGSYVSDDGHVTIRRSFGSAGYSAARFVGFCAVCSREGLVPSSGEPLSDIRAAVQFVAAHDHGGVD
jgi:hypothetical protein